MSECVGGWCGRPVGWWVFWVSVRWGAVLLWSRGCRWIVRVDMLDVARVEVDRGGWGELQSVAQNVGNGFFWVLFLASGQGLSGPRVVRCNLGEIPILDGNRPWVGP